MRWINRTQSSSSESFFPVFNWRYFFFTIDLYGLPNITFQIPQNCRSERPLEGKAVTRWDALTEHTGVSQKASFPFLSEDISFFTTALYGLPNITLQISQEQSYWTASWEKSCNSVRWINRTHSSYSEIFFPVFTEDISFFTIALYGLPNIP